MKRCKARPFPARNWTWPRPRPAPPPPRSTPPAVKQKPPRRNWIPTAPTSRPRRAQVQQAEARLQQAELDLSYTTVAAPRDGRVTRRTVEQGAYVANRAGAAGHRAGRGLGGGQFQGDAIGATCGPASRCASAWMPIRSANSRARWTASRPVPARASACCRRKTRWAITSRSCSACR